jgi:hypothetical protein
MSRLPSISRWRTMVSFHKDFPCFINFSGVEPYLGAKVLKPWDLTSFVTGRRLPIMNKSSSWTALRNPAFRRLSIATVISGTCVSQNGSTLI